MARECIFFVGGGGDGGFAACVNESLLTKRLVLSSSKLLHQDQKMWGAFFIENFLVYKRKAERCVIFPS